MTRLTTLFGFLACGALLQGMTGCATGAGEAGASANGNAAPAAPVVAAAPDTQPQAVAAAAPPAPILVGKSYRRISKIPNMIDQTWQREIVMETPPASGFDFALVESDGKKLAISASRAKKIKGRLYEYDIQSEMLLPANVQNDALARCSEKPKAKRGILVAFDDEQQPKWAIELDASGQIVTVPSERYPFLYCVEKPRQF